MNIVSKGVWPRPTRRGCTGGARGSRRQEHVVLPDEMAAQIAAQWSLPGCPTLAGTDVLRVNRARIYGLVDW